MSMISLITVRFDFNVGKIPTDFLSEIVSESANSASARGGGAKGRAAKNSALHRAAKSAALPGEK